MKFMKANPCLTEFPSDAMVNVDVLNQLMYIQLNTSKVTIGAALPQARKCDFERVRNADLKIRIVI